MPGIKPMLPHKATALYLPSNKPSHNQRHHLGRGVLPPQALHHEFGGAQHLQTLANVVKPHSAELREGGRSLAHATA